MTTRWLLALCALSLSGCVSYYPAPAQTVVYRDVHGLTSGVYEGQTVTTYRSYAPYPSFHGRSVYAPYWSVDSFYFGHGWGPAYGWGYDPWYSGWNFGFSWSSGYRYPGSWYAGYWDPWYCPPYRYGWYAPWRPYRRYDHWASNAPYWRDGHGGRHDRYDSDYAGYRNGDRRNATLDPDWRRDPEAVRQPWAGDDIGERVDRRQRPGPRAAERVVMPAASTGGDSAMLVRSGAQTKESLTRMHRDPQPSGDFRPPVGGVRQVSGVPSVQPGRAATSVRSPSASKARPVMSTPAPVPMPRTGMPQREAPRFEAPQRSMAPAMAPRALPAPRDLRPAAPPPAGAAPTRMHAPPPSARPAPARQQPSRAEARSERGDAPRGGQDRDR